MKTSLKVYILAMLTVNMAIAGAITYAEAANDRPLISNNGLYSAEATVGFGPPIYAHALATVSQNSGLLGVPAALTAEAEAWAPNAGPFNPTGAHAHAIATSIDVLTIIGGIGQGQVSYTFDITSSHGGSNGGGSEVFTVTQNGNSQAVAACNDCAFQTGLFSFTFGVPFELTWTLEAYASAGPLGSVRSGGARGQVTLSKFVAVDADGNEVASASVFSTDTPEPGTVGMAGLVLLALGVYGRRRVSRECLYAVIKAL